MNQFQPMNEIGEGINEINHCPLMKARIILNGNNKENKNKDRKQFIERTGDWICFNCQNLNFAFRTNCNRCHISKIENQQFIQNLGLNGNINNFQ